MSLFQGMFQACLCKTAPGQKLAFEFGFLCGFEKKPVLFLTHSNHTALGFGLG